MSDSGPEYFATARDVVRQGPDGSLEVYSRLPKDHWTANVMEIRYEGDPYVLVDRAVLEGEGGQPRRYLFRLKKLADEAVFAGVCDYEPEEVREIYRRQRLAKSAMWVEALPFVWGLVDEERQQGLGRMYDYDPRRSTGWSLIFTAVLGGVLVLTNLMIAHARSTLELEGGGLFRGAMVLVGALMLFDVVRRWVPYMSDRLRPSLVSPLLAPLADRFLRWERWP